MPETENSPQTGGIDFDTVRPIEAGYVPPLMSFWPAGATKPAFLLSPSGQITLPPGVSLDEASRLFWEVVQDNTPSWVDERASFFERHKFLEDAAVTAAKIRRDLIARIEVLEEERRQLLELARAFTNAAAELTRRLVITSPCAPQHTDGTPIANQNGWGHW